MRVPPIGRPAASAEDVERVTDRDRSVVTAGAALDDEVRAFATQILQPSDYACHTTRLERAHPTDKNET